MKRLLISLCALLFIGGDMVIAQEKTKTKEETKKKDKDADMKIKDKNEKYKVKEGDSKTKIKEDDMKMKEGYMETKVDDTKMKEGDMKQSADSSSMSSSTYSAGYSSSFEMGNPAYSKMILDMWKDWDDNALDRHDYWADSVIVFLSDGMVIKGKQANLEGMKKFRGDMKSVKSTLHALIPLKSTDRNEDLVAIWGQEVDTYPDGKVETTELHEVWAFNKEGKIAWMRQYSAKPASQ